MSIVVLRIIIAWTAINAVRFQVNLAVILRRRLLSIVGSGPTAVRNVVHWAWSAVVILPNLGRTAGRHVCIDGVQ